MDQLKLSIDNVSKQYGTVNALSRVDLNVNEGEFITLLGPSGSGKTTLLKIIAGMIESSTGSMTIDGKDVTNAPPQLRDLGMVFQNYSLMPHMSVFENVAFPLRVRKWNEADIRDKVREALDMVRLAGYEARMPAELSGGQQQRVAIARSIIYKPSLVLMDEPLGALDKKLREQLQHEITRLHKKLGITILYVTHDQQEALSMSDRIILMNDGAIAQAGTPKELYFHPKSEFVADFLGESNFLDGTVSGQEAKRIALGSGANVLPPSDETLKAEQKVRLMLRPELIDFGPETNEAPRGNVLSATLTDEPTFLGGMTRYEFDCGLDRNVFVLKQSGFGNGFIRVGEKVRLSWNPDASVLFRV